MKTDKRLRKKIRTKGLIIALIVSCLAIGVVYALWSGEVAHKNELVADTMEASIEETFEQGSEPAGDVAKEVSFKNKGSAAAFLRVAYSETWTKTDGTDKTILSNSVGGNDVAVKNWDLTDWEDGGDGWYYYKKVLAPGATSDPVLDKVTFPTYTGDYADYAGADYQLYFRMELLQASDSPRTLNSDDVNEAASTSVWGKEAAVSGTDVTWQ